MNTEWTIERLSTQKQSPQFKAIEVGSKRIVNATAIDIGANFCTLVISGSTGIGNLVGVPLQPVVDALNGEPLDLSTAKQGKFQ